MSNPAVPFEIQPAATRPHRSLQLLPGLERTGARSAAREGLLLLGLLVLSRVALLALLQLATGGREFTDDIGKIYLPMARDPFFILRGDPTPLSHYPPLLPLLIAPVAFLRPLLGDFLALRALFTGYELLAFPFVWMILQRTVTRPGMRRLLALAFIASPMTWITGAVMCQEEVIGLIFAASIVAALLAERRLAAVALCAMAVCTVKVFFVLPLAALVLAPQERASLRGLLLRAGVGAAPIAAIYGWAALGHWTDQGSVAIASFNPPIMFCISLWTALSNLQPLPTRVMEVASVALAATVIGALLLGTRIHRDPIGAAALVKLAGALLLCFFATFYHVNPEYYALAAPMLLVLFRPRTSALVLVVGLGLPWAVNLFYGLAAVGQGISYKSLAGKSVFVETYRSLTSLDPALVHSTLLWVCVGFMGLLAIAAARETLASRPATRRIRPVEDRVVRSGVAPSHAG